MITIPQNHLSYHWHLFYLYSGMLNTPDFLHQSIIDQFSEPKVVMAAEAPSYRILLVNKAFGEFSGVASNKFRGLSFPIIFSAYNDSLSAKQILTESLATALSGKIMVELPISRYQVPLSQIPPPHWWRSEVAPVTDDDGNIVCLVFTIKVNVPARLPAEKISGSQTDIQIELAKSRLHVKNASDNLEQSELNIAAMREEMREQGVRLADMTESEYRLNRLISTTPSGLTILKGQNMIIEMANDAILRLWGRTLSDVLNHPFMTAFPELEGQAFPALIRQVLATGVRVFMPNEPVLIGLPDGTMKKIYVDFSYDALLDRNSVPEAVLVSVNDISEIVEANMIVQIQRDELEAINEEMSAANEEIHAINEELTASNEEIRNTNEELTQAQTAMQSLNEKMSEIYDRLTFALESGKLGSYDLDLLTGNMTCTAQCKANYGLPTDAVFNFPDLLQSILPQYRSYVQEKVNAAITAKGIYMADYQVAWPDGSIHWVSVSGKPVFNEEGMAIRMGGITREVTEQKADEQRKNDFIGMVSHELKTPLTSMNGYLQILQDDAQRANDLGNLQVLERAVKQVNKMTAMINGFLNVSRLESGKIQIDKTRFDMAILMKEAAEETHSLFKSHTFFFEPVEEIFVFADHDKIGHVINNLISNAVKYSTPDSAIQVACIIVNGNAQVSVKDHGIGIQSEDRQKLFDRYYRVNNTVTQSVSGFGIGLYLCAEIMQHHEGKIWVDSEAGKGSTFYFTLPVML